MKKTFHIFLLSSLLGGAVFGHPPTGENQTFQGPEESQFIPLKEDCPDGNIPLCALKKAKVAAKILQDGYKQAAEAAKPQVDRRNQLTEQRETLQKEQRQIEQELVLLSQQMMAQTPPQNNSSNKSGNGGGGKSGAGAGSAPSGGGRGMASSKPAAVQSFEPAAAPNVAGFGSSSPASSPKTKPPSDKELGIGNSNPPKFSNNPAPAAPSNPAPEKPQRADLGPGTLLPSLANSDNAQSALANSGAPSSAAPSAGGGGGGAAKGPSGGEDAEFARGIGDVSYLPETGRIKGSALALASGGGESGGGGGSSGNPEGEEGGGAVPSRRSGPMFSDQIGEGRANDDVDGRKWVLGFVGANGFFVSSCKNNSEPLLEPICESAAEKPVRPQVVRAKRVSPRTNRSLAGAAVPYGFRLRAGARSTREPQ